MPGLIMGGIVKLHVQVSKGSISLCIIRYKLQVSKVPQISNIHIVGALVSEERDTHQLKKIYAERLVPLLLHLNKLTSIVCLLCLQKTLLENILQEVKLCMSTFCLFHLSPCLARINPQQLHHQLNNISHGHTFVSKSTPLMGRCTKKDTSSSVIVISPNEIWKLDISSCHPSTKAEQIMWSIWL